jgi:hypothetical protein
MEHDADVAAYLRAAIAQLLSDIRETIPGAVASAGTVYVPTPLHVSPGISDETLYCIIAEEMMRGGMARRTCRAK